MGKPIHWEVGGHYDSPLTESRWRPIGIVVTIGLKNFFEVARSNRESLGSFWALLFLGYFDLNFT